MRYWKLIVITFFVCVALIVYKSGADRIQTTAVIEESTYHKETGVLNCTVKFEDNKGYSQRAELTKKYRKNIDAPSMHAMKNYKVDIVYNEKSPWKAEFYEPPFPWGYLVMSIAFFILLGAPKAAMSYRINSK